MPLNICKPSTSCMKQHDPYEDSHPNPNIPYLFCSTPIDYKKIPLTTIWKCFCVNALPLSTKHKSTMQLSSTNLLKYTRSLTSISTPPMAIVTEASIYLRHARVRSSAWEQANSHILIAVLTTDNAHTRKIQQVFLPLKHSSLSSLYFKPTFLI